MSSIDASQGIAIPVLYTYISTGGEASKCVKQS